MRDLKTGAICDGDVFSTCIRLVQQQVAQVCSQMVRCPAIQDPITRIVSLSSYHVRTRLPGTRRRPGVLAEGGSSRLELGAATSAMTLHATELAASLITTRGSVSAIGELLLLPRLVGASVVVVVARLIVVALRTVVVRGGVAMSGCIRCDGNYRRGRERVLRQEFVFMIEKLLVNLSQRRGILATFKLIFDWFVLLRKSF